MVTLAFSSLQPARQVEPVASFLLERPETERSGVWARTKETWASHHRQGEAWLLVSQEAGSLRAGHWLSPCSRPALQQPEEPTLLCLHKGLVAKRARTIKILASLFSFLYVRMFSQVSLITNKGPSSQSYGFSCSHVWIWELDGTEGWVLKTSCFWTVVLEKTL